VHKRRWILLTIVFLFTVAIFLFWSLGARSNVPLKIIFIGYTNEFVELRHGTVQISHARAERDTTDFVFPVPAGPDATVTLPVSLAAPVALLLVTNPGPVAVNVFGPMSPAGSASSTLTFWGPIRWPRVLHPGESIIIKGVVDPSQDQWWAEVGYQRPGFRYKILGWAWNLGNPTLQAWLGRLFPPVEFLRSAPVTNHSPNWITWPQNPPSQKMRF